MPPDVKCMCTHHITLQSETLALLCYRILTQSSWYRMGQWHQHLSCLFGGTPGFLPDMQVDWRRPQGCETHSPLTAGSRCGGEARAEAGATKLTLRFCKSWCIDHSQHSSQFTSKCRLCVPMIILLEQTLKVCTYSQWVLRAMGLNCVFLWPEDRECRL